MTSAAILRSLRVLTVAGALTALAGSAAQAQRANPFAGLSGNWGGPGTISLNTGAKEKIRCRAQYRVADSGVDLQLELRCASDTYKFELQIAVSHKDGAISGTWSEVTRGAAGTISGTSNAGGHLNLKASSPIFSAQLAVTTRGTQQQISIQSPGNEITGVAINLSRGAK